MKRYLLLLAVVLFFAGTASAQVVLGPPPDVSGQLGSASSLRFPYTTTCTNSYASPSPTTYPCTMYTYLPGTFATPLPGYASTGLVGRVSATCFFQTSASQGSPPGPIESKNRFTCCFGDFRVVFEFDLSGLAGIVTQANYLSAELDNLQAEARYVRVGFGEGCSFAQGDQAAGPSGKEKNGERIIGPNVPVDLHDLGDDSEDGSATFVDDFDNGQQPPIDTLSVPETPGTTFNDNWLSIKPK